MFIFGLDESVAARLFFVGSEACSLVVLLSRCIASPVVEQELWVLRLQQLQHTGSVVRLMGCGAQAQ